MDVREKLVELLNNSFAEQYEKRGLLTAPHTATDLISHGVTVQEWISVKERLPKGGEIVLCNTNYFFEILQWDERADMWVDQYRSYRKNYVTHWQYLPKPPKVETIYCKDCEHLMFSDCYGECAKGYKGIVQPNDTCEHARRKPLKGE